MNARKPKRGCLSLLYRLFPQRYLLIVLARSWLLNLGRLWEMRMLCCHDSDVFRFDSPIFFPLFLFPNFASWITKMKMTERLQAKQMKIKETKVSMRKRFCRGKTCSFKSMHPIHTHTHTHTHTQLHMYINSWCQNYSLLVNICIFSKEMQIFTTTYWICRQ